jgi:hypothetical protein
MPTIRIPGGLALVGGPTLKISVGGKIYDFEDHSYCGPTALNKRGDPLANQPAAFLEAASLWCQQGKRMEDGLARWDHEPEPIVKWVGKRTAIITGYHPAKRGE